MSLQAMAEATRRLDELSCARVVANAADAVHAAQSAQKGQPLGTVTPDAIVVSSDGSVGLRPGTAALAYTAPERLRGDASDRRADVFALGVVLWEALARAPLFTGADDASIKLSVLGAALRLPSEYNANVPAELDAICKKALARDPADRYPSAKVMSAEIDAVLGDAGYPESNAEIAAYVTRASSKFAKTQLLGSLSDASSSRSAPRPTARSEGSSSLVTTALLGSNAVASPAAVDASPFPPLSRSSAPLPVPFWAGHAVDAPSFGPPEMPQPAPVSTMSGTGAPVAAHPQSSIKASASAMETAATVPVPVLSMPPGITVAPSLPPAVLQTADGELDDARHPDPIEPVDLAAMRRGDHRGSASRDVLAGWGWTTGASQIVDDSDHFVDHARASRKRLLIAIGGALGVLLVILAAAFAFSGSTPTANVDPAATAMPSATAPSPAVPPSPPSAPAVTPAAAPADPAPAAPAAPPPAEAVKPEAPDAEPAAAAPAPAPRTTEPAPAPATTASAPEPIAKPLVAEPPKAEPAKPAPASKPLAPPKKIEPRKPDLRIALKAPDKTPKRAPVNAAIKAQPVDPYAIPTERSKPDPAAAYRTGLQQYARGDTTGALATFRGSLASSPGFAPTWRGLGLVYEKLSNKTQARAAFKRYLQLAPAAGDAEQIRDRLRRLGS